MSPYPGGPRQLGTRGVSPIRYNRATRGRDGVHTAALPPFPSYAACALQRRRVRPRGAVQSPAGQLYYAGREQRQTLKQAGNLRECPEQYLAASLGRGQRVGRRSGSQHMRDGQEAAFRGPLDKLRTYFRASSRSASLSSTPISVIATGRPSSPNSSRTLALAVTSAGSHISPASEIVRPAPSRPSIPAYATR